MWRINRTSFQVSCWSPPCEVKAGITRETDAMLDDPEISPSLKFCVSVWRRSGGFGYMPRPSIVLASPVVAMAHRAMVGEVAARVLQNLCDACSGFFAAFALAGIDSLCACRAKNASSLVVSLWR